MVCVTLCVTFDSKVEWETYLMRWVFQHAKAGSRSHQNTHAHTYCSYGWQLCMCVCVHVSVSFVCHWQVYCSREAASCVSFSQGVCFLFCRIHFQAASSLSHIHRVQFLGYTQSPQSYFLSKQTQYSSEKQTLFYVRARLKENIWRATTFIWLYLWAG